MLFLAYTWKKSDVHAFKKPEQDACHLQFGSYLKIWLSIRRKKNDADKTSENVTEVGNVWKAINFKGEREAG